MTIGEWFELHEDVEFTIDHPKTRAGHKTDIEMWSRNSGAKVFRETITYAEITEERCIELLNEMHAQIRNIEIESKRRESN